MATSQSTDDAALWDLLRPVSVATLSTVLFAKGLRHQVMQGVHRLTTGAPKLMGRATTLRYIPAREDLDTLSVFANPEHPQRKIVEEIQPGRVLVVDCRGDARAAGAGGILCERLHQRGCAGFVTDGGLRDSEEIAAGGMPAYCRKPAAATNLVHHHAVDIDSPVGCGEVAVYPDDVILGDGDGIIVIPAHLAQEVAREANEKHWFEEYVIERVRNGESIRGLYPPNEDTLADYRRKTGGGIGGKSGGA